MNKSKQKEAGPILDALNIKKYIKMGVIGRGGFGKVTHEVRQVWKIENKKDKKLYALKQMSKARYLIYYFEYYLKRVFNL